MIDQSTEETRTQRPAGHAEAASHAPSRTAAGTNRANGERAAGEGSAKTKPRSHVKQRKPRQNFIARKVNAWCDRLVGAIADGSLSDQEEEYESHSTSKDYVWSGIGMGAWGMVFPILTIVVTQLVGTELAGMFSMAFVTGSLLMIVANYGVRTFQISDLDEEHSFSDYQANRLITCLVMIAAGIGYCMVRGYEADMFVISLGVYFYKMVDGLADVYEGRLQQMDKFYLSGISQAFRSVVVLVVFSLVLAVTRSLPVASVAMGIAAIATFLFLTLPLALLETPKSRRWTPAGVAGLFKQCFPLFIALFMYALIDNMPKFVMEGVLSYDNQLYFNALYFPAQGILLSIGFIYKPLLVRMAAIWADRKSRKKFDLIILAIVAVIVAMTLLTAFFMGWIGIPLMSFFYGVDFEQFRGLSYIMIAAGGVTALIDFLYQVITVLRRQKAVTKLYLITFGFSLFVPVLLVNFTGLPGAVIGYLIVMAILCVLLISEYISIRLGISKEPPTDDEEQSRRQARQNRRAAAHARLSAKGSPRTSSIRQTASRSTRA